MRQDTLRAPEGATHKPKRVGRGNGSGHGTTATKGIRGQKAQTKGNAPKRAFQGGQVPLVLHLPKKRGFHNKFRVEYAVVNLEQLTNFEAGTEVTLEKLLSAGIVRSLDQPIKILGDGELKQPLIIKSVKVSASAKAKIEAAGGKVEEPEHVAEAK